MNTQAYTHEGRTVGKANDTLYKRYEKEETDEKSTGKRNKGSAEKSTSRRSDWEMGREYENIIMFPKFYDRKYMYMVYLF